MQIIIYNSGFGKSVTMIENVIKKLASKRHPVFPRNIQILCSVFRRVLKITLIIVSYCAGKLL